MAPFTQGGENGKHSPFSPFMTSLILWKKWLIKCRSEFISISCRSYVDVAFVKLKVLVQLNKFQVYFNKCYFNMNVNGWFMAGITFRWKVPGESIYCRVSYF